MPPTLNTPPTKQVVFTDFRHIMSGDIEWHRANGENVPLNNPLPPAGEVYPQNGMIARGIRLVAQKGTKGEPFTKPGGFCRVIRDTGVFRSWYTKVEYPPGRDFGSSSQDTPLGMSVGYTESRDGVEWSEPRFSPFHIAGVTAVDGAGAMIDPAAPASERYKLVFMADVKDPALRAKLWERFQRVPPRYRDTRLRPDRVSGMWLLTSPDGLSWTPRPEPFMVHWSDTDTSITWDDYLSRYVMFTRLYHEGRRGVARAESPDFVNWTGPEEIITARLDEPASRDVYTNGYTLYPGLPQQHLMFPMFYNRFDQTSEIRLYSSETGVHWKEVAGGPVIEPGPVGAWDSEFIVAGKDLTELPGDRVGIPYGGCPYPHKYPRWPGILPVNQMAWVTWQRGRLCAVKADEEGAFFTFWMNPAGRTLRLNFRSRRGGVIRVGLFEVNGRSTAECDPMHGDELSRVVTWKGQSDFGTPANQPVMLHFELRAAEVFGFEFV